jgi:hypothetical protein
MAKIHRLPSPDDQRMIDMLRSEVREDFRAVVREEIQRALAGKGEDNTPVSVKVAAKALGTGEPRVREWCKHGCEECGELLPSTMTGDERGRKLYVSEAREWMKYHRDSGGCSGKKPRT